jgi:glycosyltransferase involved in cell wall biosynthesis
MKIPVIQIPTYFVSPFRMSFVLDRAETEGLNGIPLARWYAVYGDQCRSVLENSGVPKEGIRVVGLHRLDGMLQQVKKGGFNRTEIRGKYGIPKGSGVVLIATQTYEESPKLIEETWLALQLGNHATTPILWIKPHPNYPMNDILARVKEKHKSGKELRHVLFDKTANLHELMCAADIVVTTFSTSGLEAMALGAPTVWANFAGLSSLLNPDLFTQFGLHCNDRTSFRDRLMLLLQQPENRAKVGDQCLKDVPKLLGPLDGLASRRTADLIAMAANA